MSQALLSVLERIAAALEAQAASDDDALEFPLETFGAFDWSSIGATVVQKDADGVSAIRTADGKIAKRRSNDKFGTEIWFSYAAGKQQDGKVVYRRVATFRDTKPAEPLGRKTAAAVQPGRTLSPLVAPLIQEHKKLADEVVILTGHAIPARFGVPPVFDPPQLVLLNEELRAHVGALRDAAGNSRPEGAKTVGDVLASFKAWLKEQS